MEFRIETERLILRPFKTEDAEAFYLMGASDDNGVKKYLEGWDFKNVSSARDKVESYIKGENVNFIVLVIEHNKEFVGVVAGSVSTMLRNSTMKITYAISPEHRGNGYCTEAVKAFVRNMYEVLGISTFKFHILKGNVASVGCARKVGAVYTFTYGSPDEFDIYILQMTPPPMDAMHPWAILI